MGHWPSPSAIWSPTAQADCSHLRSAQSKRKLSADSTCGHSAAEASNDVGPNIVCQPARLAVDGPLFTAQSISSIASTLAQTSGPTSSRQFSTVSTQKKSILPLIPSNMNSGRGSSLNGVVDERASNHCSKSSFCNASRSAPLHSAY